MGKLKIENNSDQIIGREDEISKIVGFLKSKNLIFHITGNPGTGKTSVIKHVLGKQPFCYLNYLQEENLNTKIKEFLRSKIKILVLDEFDKFYLENKKECLKAMINLKRKLVKTITISNDLRMGNLKFMPYSVPEMLSIIKTKTKNNYETDIDEIILRYLILNYGKQGDVRAVLTKLNGLMSRTDGKKLQIKDLREQKQETENRGIHHEIIGNIKKEGVKGIEGYKEYYKVCEEMMILPLERHIYTMIYDGN